MCIFRLRHLGLATALAILLAGCQQRSGSSSSGSSAADFYKGKMITLIVPYNPGGGFDQYPRLAQPVLEKYLPGTAIVVQNVPGAGGIVGMNQLYRAKPDGLTIGFGSIGGMEFGAVTGQPGVNYDLSKFTWIGRVCSEPRALAVSAKSSISTIDDLKKLGRPVMISATGVGSDDYYIATVMFKALGIPMKAATGYGGQQESSLAIMRGEVDCTVSSLGGVESSIDAGELKPILFMADKPVKQFEKVSLVKDVVDPSQLELVHAVLQVLALERSFIAPPGVPAARLAYLRQAFDKAYSDPNVIDRLKKAKRLVEWLDGTTCEQKIMGVIAGGQVLKPFLGR